MRLSYLAQYIFLFLLSSTAMTGQRFACDGQLLMAMNDGESTTILRPVFIPFSPPFLSPIMRYTGGSFDGLGFNSVDNFIYGVEQGTNNIIRLKNNSTYETVGTVGLVDTLKSNAGDCTPDGLYLCHDYQLNQILVFDVVNSFTLVREVDLFWDPTTTNNGAFRIRFYDIAVDPSNPSIAYAYQGIYDPQDIEPDQTQGQLFQIDINLDSPSLGKVTPMISMDQSAANHLGALLFSSRSELFGFGSTSLGPILPQTRLISIDPVGGGTGTIATIAQGSILSDGCSCPYPLEFSNRVPTEGMYCNNDQKSIYLTITNNSFNLLDGVTLVDTLPEGMILEGISDSFVGNVTIGTGVGFEMLEITNLQISPKSTIDIELKIKSIDAVVGPETNQAFLYNLPEIYADRFPSDDPGNPGQVGEPSLFFVTARELEDVTWEIFSPTDCIDAIDGKIVLTSPQFFPGQEFEIKLRNKIGWDEVTNQVVVDDNNSITVDSLIPGDYQVFQVRSLSDNCSLALKDTTILIEGPNDLLQLSVGSNSPICEGEDLLMESIVSPGGEIRWTGPDLYVSDQYVTVVDSAQARLSGEYKIVLNYGYCEQSRFLEVDVKQSINASVSGDTVYCGRDKLLLDANGKGDDLLYSWHGPSGHTAMDSILSILSLSRVDDGVYQVIVDNNACKDTVRLTVTVLPTPTINLVDNIITDFCSPEILEPEIMGDNNVRFLWTPEEGLSCNDCPNPELQPIVQSRYSLKVENDFSCSDSTSVQVKLDEENLVHYPNIVRLNSIIKNDIFTLYPGCVVHKIESLNVYGRWGGKVFSSIDNDINQPSVGWDGFIGNNKAGLGVYMWVAKIELVDGSLKVVSGDVTVL